MYAIVETGAKQYKVSKGDILEVERDGKKNEKEVKLNKVLLIVAQKEITVGNPYIKGACVVCQFIGEKRGKKTISFRYRRRHASSKKKIGHRQDYMVLKVMEISS